MKQRDNRKAAQARWDKMLSEYMAEKGSKGGRKAALAMTPEQRSERARKAIQARWAKRQEGK